MSYPGLVYVLDADHGVKVGITQQTIEQRVDDLRRSSGLVEITVTRVWPRAKWSDARMIERAAHGLLDECRTVGEWFHCHPFEACDAVERAIREPGLWLFSADELARIRARRAA